MTKEFLEHSRCRRWRLVLLLLVVISLLPEIVMGVTVAFAEITGCQPDQTSACVIGSLPVSDVIALALEAGTVVILAGVRTNTVWLVVLYAGVAAWLCLCLIVVTLGWARTLSRLLLGLAMAIVFAFLPYFAPLLVVDYLANDNCRPNEGGLGACKLFGDYVGGAEYSPVHDAVVMGWLAWFGIPLALGIFIIYALVVIVIGVSSSRHFRTAVR